MTEEETVNSPPGVSKRFDLERRTEEFARQVRYLARMLPRTLANLEDVPQLVCASGSVAANYIEANESLGSKDKLMRMKIARKEAKETRLFLRLVDTRGKAELDQLRQALEDEATELMNILGAIIRKLE
jgi:four helix bundle protein